MPTKTKRGIPDFWLVGVVRAGLCEDGSLSWQQMLQSLYGQTPLVWAERNNQLNVMQSGSLQKLSTDLKCNLLSACQPSHRCSQRCSLFAQTVQWTESSDIHSLAFQRSPIVSHIVGTWPSPLNDTKRKTTLIYGQYDNNNNCVVGWYFKTFYLTANKWSFARFIAWSISILQSLSVYLGSFHRGPRWECFVLCLRSSGIVLLMCRPAEVNRKIYEPIPMSINQILNIFLFLNTGWLI